jgi:basic membrane protein A and related proteins
MNRLLPLALLGSVCVLGDAGCTRNREHGAEEAGGKLPGVGLVTDVGGRGDGSFNDSALRGLELWAAGKIHAGGKYREATLDELRASLSKELLDRDPPIAPLRIRPLVLQSRAQEDYEPNLQLLADHGASLTIGVGFMLENAIETVARRSPDERFLLLDSPLLDARGNPFSAPNVRTVVFREEEGSFLVGALAGLVSRTGKVGFVGGMGIPLIKKFESGYRAGVRTTRPGGQVLTSYTGSFDNVAAGKQVAQDLIAKGADVVFHAAGADGLGMIQAVREARASGRQVWAIGVDSDQSHLAPGAVLTSMLKRVDLAVYEVVRELVEGRFKAGDSVWGLAEGGVTFAEVVVDFPGKAEALAQVEALRTRIVEGKLKVPATTAELSAFEVAR